MKSTLLSTAERLDEWLPAGITLQRCSSRLVILLVHSLYLSESEADEAGVYPHERMTVDKLRQFLDAFLEMGYTFVSPNEVLTARRIPNRAMMLTFDDGYYNFVRGLPLLREYHIPTTLFVCPGNVVNQESFWWDAYYRNSLSNGAGKAHTCRQIAQLRKLPFDQIRRIIVELWGTNALRAETDLDRPLFLDELRDVAKEPIVNLGNHTFRHTALPFHSEADIKSEILLAEGFFEREFGAKPRVISYPNGDYSNSVIRSCADLGYDLGMTIDPRWNTKLQSAKSPQLLSLGRYMLSGDRDVRRQAKSVNLPRSVSATIRRMKKHNYN